MRHNLTSLPQQPNKQLMQDYKIDENNPAHLRKVIEKLMQKSKTIIEVLESTVKRLQKVEREKQYWKNNYLNFRQVCQQYIEADGIRHYKQVVKLQQQLKRIEIQNQCLIEQSRHKYNPSFTNRYDESVSMQPRVNTKSFNSIQNRHNSSTNQLFDMNYTSKKPIKDKSISSISSKGSPVRSQHQINPKKKLIKLQTKNTDKNN